MSRRPLTQPGDSKVLVNFCIPKSQKDDFKKLCKSNGTSFSKELRSFIERSLNKK